MKFGLSIFALFLSLTAFANEREFHPVYTRSTEPATRYSGRTPIDLTNGLPFNNGTYGLPNGAYEAWAKDGVIFPGVSEKTYPFQEKRDFVRGLEESAGFVRDAIWNYSNNVTNTWPEAQAHAKAATETLQPALNEFEGAIKAADGAGKDDWEAKQNDARRALVKLRGTYSQLHRNVTAAR